MWLYMAGGGAVGEPPNQTLGMETPRAVQLTVFILDLKPLQSTPRRGAACSATLSEAWPSPLPCLSLRMPLTPAHAIMMTLKSSQFQGSRRNVKSSMQKPRASTLMRDSNV